MIFSKTKLEPINISIKSPTDLLKDFNNTLSKKLGEHDVFDVDIPTKRLNCFLKVLDARNLSWHNSGFEHDNKTTIVVGKIGADFKRHEKNR